MAMANTELKPWEVYVIDQIAAVFLQETHILKLDKIIFKQLDLLPVKTEVFSHIANGFVEGKKFFFETHAKAREKDLSHSALQQVTILKKNESVLTEKMKREICDDLRLNIADVAFFWAVSGKSASWIEQRILSDLNTIFILNMDRFYPPEDPCN